MQEMTVSATMDQIGPVTEFVNTQLAQLACPERIRIQVDVAVDELFGNIVRYAYGSGTGPATVRVDVEDEPLRVIISFVDNGVPYDPLSAEFADTTHLPAKERPIGGLGLYMVKKTMDDISYCYRDGQNILTIRKSI
ncbi:MAG: ATP-binding protein [Clostridia bacterium]|nr:ATP-binding protein [Clostridia bacterium]